jgi:hypothetical protein
MAAWATSVRRRLWLRAWVRSRVNASARPVPARSEMTPLACSITTRLVRAADRAARSARLFWPTYGLISGPTIMGVHGTTAIVPRIFMQTIVRLSI